MRKTFNRKQEIDSFLKYMDYTSDNYKPYSFESNFVPNLGNTSTVYKPNYDKRKLSRRQKLFSQLKNEAKKCQLCGFKPENSQSLVIDHEHSSGKIRGVLCQNCNSGLGKFLDSIKLLKKAIKFLMEFETKREQAISYGSPIRNVKYNTTNNSVDF